MKWIVGLGLLLICGCASPRLSDDQERMVRAIAQDEILYDRVAQEDKRIDAEIAEKDLENQCAQLGLAKKLKKKGKLE